MHSPVRFALLRTNKSSWKYHWAHYEGQNDLTTEKSYTCWKIIFLAEYVSKIWPNFTKIVRFSTIQQISSHGFFLEFSVFGIQVIPTSIFFLKWVYNWFHLAYLGRNDIKHTGTCFSKLWQNRKICWKWELRLLERNYFKNRCIHSTHKNNIS